MRSRTITFLWPPHVKYNIVFIQTAQRNGGFRLHQGMKPDFGTVSITEDEKCHDPTVNVNFRDGPACSASVISVHPLLLLASTHQNGPRNS